MKKNYREDDYSSPFLTTKKISSYCDKHRRLLKNYDQNFNDNELQPTTSSHSKSSSSYYAPPTNENFHKSAIVRTYNSTTNIDKKLTNWIKNERNNDEPFLKTINVQQQQRQNDYNTTTVGTSKNVSWPDEEVACSQSISSDTLQTEDQKLLRKFKRLSLTTNQRNVMDDNLQRNLDNQQPKIVKAKDTLKRASVKRMFVYPPEGQTGEPISLVKKWSNIDCHVRGDSLKGYRYKVYYVQEFESDRWLPDTKTGGPFHQMNDYSSSDNS